MKYCEKCGNELFDEAVLCPKCGCPVEAPAPEPVPVKKKKSKKGLILGIIGGVVALALIVVAILFVPRSIELKDLKETNVVMNLIRFGLPERIDNGTWVYEEMEFEGVTVDYFAIKEDGDGYYIMTWGDSEEDLASAIRRKCDFDRSNAMYDCYSYGDLEISMDPSGWYVTFEVIG